MPTLPDLFATLADAIAPSLRAAALDAFSRLASSISEPDLAAAIARAGGDRARLVVIVDTLLADAVTDAAFIPLRDALREAVVAGGQVVAGSIGGILDAAGTQRAPIARAAIGEASPLAGDTIRVTFDAINPRVIESVRAAELELFPELARGVRDGARALIADGLEAGGTPATIARQIRPLLGLTEYQAQIVANYRRELESGDGGALDRALRDRRFDRTATKAVGGVALTPEQVDRMVSAYGKNVLKSNAETIARTESINALKRGQLGAWEAAASEGAVDRDELVKVWKTRLDGRERPTHHDMNGTVVAFDGVFQVPGVGAQVYPGASEFSCRCSMQIVPRWVYELSADLAQEAA